MWMRRTVGDKMLKVVIVTWGTVLVPKNTPGLSRVLDCVPAGPVNHLVCSEDKLLSPSIMAILNHQSAVN